MEGCSLSANTQRFPLTIEVYKSNIEGLLKECEQGSQLNNLQVRDSVAWYRSEIENPRERIEIAETSNMQLSQIIKTRSLEKREQGRQIQELHREIERLKISPQAARS